MDFEGEYRQKNLKIVKKEKIEVNLSSFIYFFAFFSCVKSFL